MRHWLLPYVVASTGLLLALDAAVGRLLRTNPSGSAAKLGRLADPSRPEELPIFGSSRALGSLLPSIIGHQSFNYGIEGARSELTELLLRVEHTSLRRSVVLVNLDYEFFLPGVTHTGDPTSFVPSASFPPYQAFLRRAGLDRWYYRVPGLRFFGSFEAHLKASIQTRYSPTKTFDRGAACDLNPHAPERLALHVEARRRQPAVIDVEPVRARAFRDAIVALAPRIVLLCVSPYHPVYEQGRRMSEASERFFAELRGLPHVRRIDVETGTYPDELFSDTSHLNCEGARRYSSEVALRLRELGIRTSSPVATASLRAGASQAPRR